MIGNEVDATYALGLGYGSDEYWDEGGFRRAFLVNGVLYKVPIHDEDLFINCRHSWDEYKHYQLMLPHMQDPLALPRMTVYTVGEESIPVTACEFINGRMRAAEWSDYAHLVPSVANHLFDLCGDNVLYYNDKFYLVDLGC